MEEVYIANREAKEVVAEEDEDEEEDEVIEIPLLWPSSVPA